jgi:hypothetical protein
MPLALVIGGVTQTTKILEGSGSLKFNTFDVTLVDPATVPVNGNALTLTTPTWAGTVTSVTRYPGPRIGHDYVTLTATNTDVASASAGPWGLSDVPNGTTLRGYKDLRVTVSTNLDATITTTGTATLYDTGLWPAMTFALTNADLGYSATSFSVTGMEVTWVKGVPFYHLTFGDPIVTMSVWMNNTVSTMPDGSISGTKITDLSVTTPKLATGAVTAAKINVSGSHNLVVNGGFETCDSVAPANLNTGPLIAAALPGWTAVATTFAGNRVEVFSGVIYSPHTGVNNITLTWGPGTPSGSLWVYSDFLSIIPGRTYLGRTFMRGRAANSGASNGSLYVQWYDNTAAAIGSITLVQGPVSTTVTTTTWVELIGTTVAPSNAASVRVVLVNHNSSAGGNGIVFDDVELYPYADTLLNTPGEVTIDTSGLAITNGALTVTNAGAVVIIDGTSDMFKIAASGSLSSTCAALSGANYSTSVATATLSGLGALSATPMHLSSIADNNGNTGTRSVGHDLLYNVPSAAWTGVTSGGATSGQAILPTSIAGNMSTHLNGSSICVVQLDVNNAYTSSETLYGYYYILVESAL